MANNLDLENAVKCIRENRFDEAINYAQRYIKEKPNSAEALNVLAVAFQKNGNSGEAMTVLEKAREIDPDNLSYILNLFDIYISTGLLDEASCMAKAGADLKPDDFDVQLANATIKLKNGEYKSALNIYLNLIQHVPTMLAAYLGAAHCYNMLEQWKNAEHYYQIVLQSNPAHVEAGCNLGFVLLGYQLEELVVNKISS